MWGVSLPFCECVPWERQGTSLSEAAVYKDIRVAHPKAVANPVHLSNRQACSIGTLTWGA